MLSNIDWDPLLDTDIDRVWNNWQAQFLSVMELCIPKGVLPKRKHPPWITKQIRNAIYKRNQLFRKFRISNDLRTFSRYKNLRNRVTSMLRKGKKTYMNSLQSANAIQFWRAVKHLNGKSVSSIPVLRRDGEEACTDRAKAVMLNNFFSSCFNQSMPPLTESSYQVQSTSQECPDDLLCTEEEVLELLLSLDVTKSSGPDGISARMLKATATSIASSLCRLFNLSVTTGHFPAAWKISNVVPIPKDGDKSAPNNYRPISLLPIVSKLLERHVHGRVMKHLNESHPLSDHQWGFRPGKSTTHALLSATNEWFELLDAGAEVGAIFFDLSKAFDSVPHKALLEKLKRTGLNGLLCDWIANYLTNRKQRVVVNGEKSNELPVLSGVPQGSVLGPLLFLIYINDIDNIPFSPGTKLVIYANDVLLYRPIRSPLDYELLQKDIDAVGLWSTSNYLKFNPRKCNAMVFSRKRPATAPIRPLMLNGQTLDIMDMVKYLGLTICSDLSWSRHINIITSRARRLVGLLFRQFYSCTDSYTLSKLYTTMVRPHLEYACEVWDQRLGKDSKLIERVQSFATKVCLKKWNSSYPDMLDTLNLLSLSKRRKWAKLSTLYKIVHGYTDYPSPPLIPRTQFHSSRYVHDFSFVQPFARTSQTLFSFFPHTLSLWNNLPYSIVSCRSPSVFKHHIMGECQC